MQQILQMSVRELHERLQQDNPPVVLDVREAWEVTIAQLDSANPITIPMDQIPGRMNELDADSEIVIICHHGVRSYQVAAFLAAQGFSHVINLAGGINAWSLEIDGNIPRY